MTTLEQRAKRLDWAELAFLHFGFFGIGILIGVAL